MTLLNGSIESAWITDTGLKRKTNQDTCYANDIKGLYIVADGMGGQQGGDIASQLTVKTIRSCFEKPFETNTEIQTDATPDHSLSEPSNRLISSIDSANTVVFQKAAGDPLLKGMGSTVSAVFLTGDTIITANVGDSPIFLIRDHQIDPLFVSHSMAACFHENSIFSKNAGHMLTRAVGAEETVQIDSCEIQCFKNDIIVLCSDGLTNMVATETIREIAENESPASACRKLVALANKNGGYDNTTIIVVKIKSIRHNKPEKKTWFQKIMCTFNPYHF